jgi:hypothetical protein
MKYLMIDPKQVREADGTKPEGKLREMQKAILEGFGDYRRKIAEIRSSHGKENRKSLPN